ncbi:MAG TPA: hypothetical protein VI485_09080 [Vicinamibacterales bacterium]|nr:hypothetical protein [Vicinamibacterales bacterium]
MATPDPRLFELITLLVEVGADWLVLEVLGGVRTGLAVEESDHALLTAQLSARYGRSPEIDKERVLSFWSPRELDGDEQLRWAAAYVVERLTDEAEMLNASFERLNVLAIAQGRDGEAPPQEFKRDSSVTLQVGEDGPVIQTVEIAILRRNLAALTLALEDWLGTTGGRR